MNDLNDEKTRLALVKELGEKVDEYARVKFDDGHRNHLGASMIGRVCDREIWLGWRWVMSSRFSGRMQRLFNRGHREEERFVEWLTAAGFLVWMHDADGKQFRVSALNGHFGGSLDAILRPPDWFKFSFDILGEFKTHKASSFKDLKRFGVKKSKPEHYAQMCTYGRLRGFSHALYCAVNKDDDELYFEIVVLDPYHGDEMISRAHSIVTSQTPPKKIGETPAAYACKMCDYQTMCHGNKMPEKNCRSCVFARPVDNASWYCEHWHNVIDPSFIPVGCDNWKRIV